MLEVSYQCYTDTRKIPGKAEAIMHKKDTILALINEYDSFYLYDEAVILEHTERLKKNFPWVDFLYSVKCNPHHQILKSVFGQGFGADAASLNEVLLAAESGLEKEKIYYSAPGKTARDIEGALDKAVVIADSLYEVEKIQQAAKTRGITAKIGLRINPDFSFTGEQGNPSKFGIDEEQAIDFLKNGNQDHIKVTGIHVHIRSQELQAQALLSYYQKMCDLAEKFCLLCGGLEYVNMGSGMGIDYTKQEQPLDMKKLGEEAARATAAFREKYPDTKIMIEVGRYAVCKSGQYVTKVIDRKVSHGKTYVILKNTLNGFVRPSIAQMIMRYASDENPAACEPMFTANGAFDFQPLQVNEGSGKEENVTLVGNLCTATDVIAENVTMPYLVPGDCIVINHAGGYAAVLSPMQFASLEKPAELFLAVDGKVLS